MKIDFGCDFYSPSNRKKSFEVTTEIQPRIFLPLSQVGNTLAEHAVIQFIVSLVCILQVQLWLKMCIMSLIKITLLPENISKP